MTGLSPTCLLDIVHLAEDCILLSVQTKEGTLTSNHGFEDVQCLMNMADNKTDTMAFRFMKVTDGRSYLFLFFIFIFIVNKIKHQCWSMAKKCVDSD